MFCLRSWVPLLIFLTNASPIYVALFLIGNYALSRPCVYCSILLFVLVFSLFDFNADWFEPRWNGNLNSIWESATSFMSGNATLTDTVMETAGLAISAINGTGGSLVSAALGTARSALGHNVTAAGDSVDQLSNSTGGFYWLRAVLEKRQFRIPCVDVIVRL